MARATSELDPLHHTQKMKQRLSETVDHLRDDVDKVDELKAMFIGVIWRADDKTKSGSGIPGPPPPDPDLVKFEQRPESQRLSEFPARK